MYLQICLSRGSGGRSPPGTPGSCTARHSQNVDFHKAFGVLQWFFDVPEHPQKAGPSGCVLWWCLKSKK